MATNNTEYMREWRAKHPDYKRKKYAENKETILRQNKEWRDRNKPQLAERQKARIEARRESHKRWRDKNREHVRDRYRVYVSNNRDKVALLNRKFQLKQYGLTQADYDKMLARQSSTCAICPRTGTPETKLVVDHCHDTGKVRALLCHQCNRALGLMGDNAENVAKAARYLKLWSKRHEAPPKEA